MCTFQIQFSEWYLRAFPVKSPWGECKLIDDTYFKFGMTQIWVSIASGNGLVPDGTKPLPESNVDQSLWCHMALPEANELKFSSKNWYKVVQWRMSLCSHCWCHYLGALPINGISIEFEIRPNFAVLWFQRCPTIQSKILHTSRQCYCREVCKILLWSAQYVMNKSITNFHWISNSIKILLVGRVPGTLSCSKVSGSFCLLS